MAPHPRQPRPGVPSLRISASRSQQKGAHPQFLGFFKIQAPLPPNTHTQASHSELRRRGQRGARPGSPNGGRPSQSKDVRAAPAPCRDPVGAKRFPRSFHEPVWLRTAGTHEDALRPRDKTSALT